MADEKVIFSMNGVSKVLPHNNKVILKDIYLGFFYGAKIGILGLNGAGKSNLLKIIAGARWSGRPDTAWATWSRNPGWIPKRPCWRWCRKACRR